MAGMSRRDLLKGSAAAAGASAFGFSSLFGFSRAFGQTDAAGDDPQTILNLAATAESYAITHYYTALQNADALELTADEITNLRTFLDSEYQHLLFLQANGAMALASEFFTPINLYNDRALFVTITDTAESWFVAAYLAATRRFAELGNPLLAATTAQVMGVEAEHQALIRQMGGLVPSYLVLKEPLFYNTSEVGPLFQPFLEGAEGFEGPTAMPGASAIAEEIGDEGARLVTPFIQLTNGQGTLNVSMQTMADDEGVCMATASNGVNVNIRSGAGTSFSVAGTLSAGESIEVTGQTTDNSGFVWYQVAGGFVRSDVVQTSGGCMAVMNNAG